LVAPYANTVQNNNKCPHGFPLGSCPICSGMGGAPKDRNKPRKSGEMSYNECLAQWHRMQKAEQREKQAELNAQNTISDMKTKNNFSEKIGNLVPKLENAQKRAPVLLKPAINALKGILNFSLNATKNIFAVYQNTVQSINRLADSAAEKLSSFLGEIKNFFQGFKFMPKTKKILKTVLSLFLSKNSEEEQEENEEILRLKLREIKKSFLRIFTRDEEKTQKTEENIK